MKWLIIILICLCGCISYPIFSYTHNSLRSEGIVVPIWVDGKFSEGERVIIGDAIRQWNYVLNGMVELRVVDNEYDMDLNILKVVEGGRGWIIFQVSEEDPMVNKLSKNYLGWSDRIGGHYIYLIRERVSDDYLLGVMMHEMGHLLGAGHIDHGLMKSVIKLENSRCIDHDTVVQVSKFQHLNLSWMNYCY